MNFRDWLIKNIGIATAIIILMLVFIFFLKTDINNRVSQIQFQGRSLAERIQSIESLTSLQANSKKSEELFNKLSESLPEKDQLIGFSKELEGYAKSNNLDFGFSFGNEVEGTDSAPGINSFVLTSKGTYSDFVKFLRQIEDSKYFVGFNSFDLNKNENDFNIIIRGEVFSQ